MDIYNTETTRELDTDKLVLIKSALDKVRPVIQRDGGDVEFVSVQDNILYVRLVGACVGCPASMYTLKLGIEQAVKEVMPDIKEVIDVDADL